MLVENQKIEVYWKPRNKKRYQELGYEYTKFDDKFYVDVKDLEENSHYEIIALCDICGKEIRTEYKKYCEKVSKDGEFLCKDCCHEKAIDKIYDKVKQAYNDKGYDLLTERENFAGRESMVKYICPVHGETETRAIGLIRGNGCYKCGRDTSLKKKNEQSLNDRRDSLYRRALEKAKENGYEIITDKSEISNNTSYIQYICLKHGVQRMRISSFITGKKCPKCAEDKRSEIYRLSKDEIVARVSECGGTILNPEDYINNQKRNLNITCPKCGKLFITSFVLFTQRDGQLCPDCFNTESIGEVRIRKYLEENNIPFEQEKWFSDCRDVKPLPFDFYLPEHNLCVEFDGSQHYKDKGKFAGSLEYVQKHDMIKNQYCADKGMGIIRIPYWKIDKIGKILDGELRKYRNIA